MALARIWYIVYIQYPSAELCPQVVEALLMLPSQALLLPCHLDNELVTIIKYIYGTDCSVTHDLHLYLTWGHFLSHGTPVWHWPEI